MSKMNNLVLMLSEYELALHSYGHGDPLVSVLKQELLDMGNNLVTEEVMCIDHEFDTFVLNNY